VFGATTGEATNYKPNSITLNGRVIEGDDPITEAGFEWRVGNSGAWTAVPVQIAGDALIYELPGLTPYTTYNARAYAKAGSDAVYGEILSFEITNWHGCGSETEPYEIYTPDEMKALSQYVMDNKASQNKCWKLMNDIDMDAVNNFTPIGGWSDASTNSTSRLFSGTFNGNNHAIKNLTIDRPEGNYVALFGNVSGNGKIMKLGVVDAEISGKNYIGSLVGLSEILLVDCYATGTTVKANDYGGGLVGFQQTFGISGCYFTGTMECDVTQFVNANIGGFAGSLYNCTVSNSYARAAFNVSGASSRAGGFVGTMTVGTVSNCYTAVHSFNVSENSTAKNGLFAGEYLGGTITNCYYATSIAGYTGFGDAVDVAGLIAKTEIEMKVEVMVAHPGGKDNSLNYGQAEPSWATDPAQINNGYPVLLWQKDNFLIPTYTVNITTPTNGAITVMNGAEPVTNGAVLNSGTVLRLTATPNANYEFVQWWDGNTEAEQRTYTLTGNVTISAEFTQIVVSPLTYTVNITTPTNGTITVMNGTEPVTNGAVLNSGTVLSLTATPNANYEFVQWWDGSTEAEQRTYTLTGNVTISAEFTQIVSPLTYTVNIPPPTNGTITVMNGTEPVTNGAVLNSGTVLSLTATPNTNYKFVQWWDGNTEAEQRTYTLTGNVTISAEFAQVTGIEIPETPLVRVYPNPTNGAFALEFGIAGAYVVTISDMSGKILLRQSINDSVIRMDISNYPAGVYLLTIDDGERQSAIRVIKNP